MTSVELLTPTDNEPNSRTCPLAVECRKKSDNITKKVKICKKELKNTDKLFIIISNRFRCTT